MGHAAASVDGATIFVNQHPESELRSMSIPLAGLGVADELRVGDDHRRRCRR